MDLPIICFDMDGTLLDERGRIHPNDAALLASPEPRAFFIPSTGRPANSVHCAFARNGLYADQALPFYMVLQNGAVLMAPEEQLLSYDAFEPGVQKDLLDLAMGFPQIMFLYLSATDIHVLWPGAYGLGLSASFDFTLRPLSEAKEGTRFCKLMCISDSPAALDAMAAAVAAWPVESAFSMPPLLEITAKNANKGNGIAALLQKAGLAGQPVYAAGDGENDLSLFRIAAASFAPSAAPEAVKSAADHVIDVSREGLLAPILKIIGRS